MSFIGNTKYNHTEIFQIVKYIEIKNETLENSLLVINVQNIRRLERVSGQTVENQLIFASSAHPRTFE